MLSTVAFVCLAAFVASATGQITPEQNFNPVTITASAAPYTIIATPITPAAPYSQAAYQCNITGDARYPAAGGTFPLTVKVPAGTMVRIVFANGNLGGGAAVTQQGEPGVIVQQNGSPIVQQSGSASPIVQPVGSPVVQQTAPAAAVIVQQTPTVVQQPNTFPTAAVVAQPPPAYGYTPPVYGVRPPVYGGRRLSHYSRQLRQDRVPGGPNNGLVEYVALSSANTVPGFVVPNTQFGVPYVEFTASTAAVGQTATFKGVLVVAQVVGGVPLVPFQVNSGLSPYCQVNVNFQVA